MEKQPNSRMCFLCGIDHPIGLKLRFYTDDEGHYIGRLGPRLKYQGYPGHLGGASSRRCWTNQLEFSYTLAFWLPD